jgi:hypothetical protein
MSPWRYDIQSLVKKCRILALLFFSQVSYRYVECPTRGDTEFTLTAALYRREPCMHQMYYQINRTLKITLSLHFPLSQLVPNMRDFPIQRFLTKTLKQWDRQSECGGHLGL